jgi:hypothetical protein
MAVFHHYAFTETGQSGEEVAERLWRFCLSGLGGGSRAAREHKSVSRKDS